jgi:hypothetical protein
MDSFSSNFRTCTHEAGVRRAKGQRTWSSVSQSDPGIEINDALCGAH